MGWDDGPAGCGVAAFNVDVKANAMPDSIWFGRGMPTRLLTFE
jgi:hypothetical protein